MLTRKAEDPGGLTESVRGRSGCWGKESHRGGYMWHPHPARPVHQLPAQMTPRRSTLWWSRPSGVPGSPTRLAQRCRRGCTDRVVGQGVHAGMVQDQHLAVRDAAPHRQEFVTRHSALWDTRGDPPNVPSTAGSFREVS